MKIRGPFFLVLCCAASVLSCVPYTVQGPNVVATVAAPTPRSAQCSVAGAWRGLIRGGVLAGRMVDLTFYGNNVARGQSGAVMLEVSWEFEDSILTIVHRDSIPPAAACRLDQIGTYSVQFSDNCNSVVARSITDGCEHRRRTLDGLQARRMEL